jgi:hypothetical protein
MSENEEEQLEKEELAIEEAKFNIKKKRQGLGSEIEKETQKLIDETKKETMTVTHIAEK